jgi:hypothetical protein
MRKQRCLPEILPVGVAVAQLGVPGFQSVAAPRARAGSDGRAVPVADVHDERTFLDDNFRFPRKVMASSREGARKEIVARIRHRVPGKTSL